MLVAGAAMSLIAPICAQASDINIEGMNSYAKSKRSSSKKQKQFSSKTFSNEIATSAKNVEIQENDFKAYEAGSFSETTTLDGKAVFTLAAADHSGSYTSNNSEAAYAAYMYQMNLNTSFSGDDNLYVRLKTGNATGWAGTEEQGGYLSSSKGNSDTLKVDKIWYTFPIGESNTFWIGPEIENYYMHATTPSIYSPTLKQFTLGGNAAAYGASTNSGFGWAFNADNGFAVSSNVVSKQTNDTTVGLGLFTDDAKTSWATQVGYTQPQWSVSAIMNLKYNGWEDDYFSTSEGALRTVNSGLNSTNIGLRAWWRPESTGTAVPSISVGYDTSEVHGAPANTSQTDMIFVGLNWADMFQAEDKIGLAFGQPQTAEDETVDPFSYELYYQYSLNDATSLRTTYFSNSDRDGTSGNDNTGVVVESTFKF